MYPSGSCYLLALSFFISTSFRWQDLFRVTTFRSYLFDFAEIGYQAITREVVEATPVATMGPAKLSKVRLPVSEMVPTFWQLF